MPDALLRFHWAASLMNVEPDSRILEIGCGTGTLAATIAEKLDAGRITAIDKSPSMIAKAITRNQGYIDTGRVQLLQSDFEHYAGSEHIFDKIVAFNVRLFLRQACDPLRKVRQLLARQGQFYLFYQFPYDVDITAADPIIEQLEGNAFKIVRKTIKKLKPTTAFGVIATPKVR